MPAVEEKKVNWVPVVAVGVGVTAVGLGYYLYTRKPPGVEPGGDVRARFKFDYLGEGGDYVIQVSFGILYPLDIFDHIEGMTWQREIELAGPDTYEFDLDCEIPPGTAAKQYDAEALIRTPEMDTFDYLIRRFTKRAITVRE